MDMATYQTVISGTFADCAGEPFEGWIGINDGSIANVYKEAERPAASLSESYIEFDEGCLVMPGFVDPHVHCREPGREYKEDWHTLGLAAAHGGVTTIATMPNYGKGNSVTTRERLQKVKELSGKCIVEKRFWAGLCPDNLGKLGEMDDPSVIGWKGFTTDFDPDLDFTKLSRSDFLEYLREAVKQAARTGKPSAWHCEDASLFVESAKSSGEQWAYADWRCPASEYAMASDLIDFARDDNARIHICHASIPETVQAVAKYYLASTEVTFHHMLFDKYDMSRDKRLKMNPPLREPGDKDAIRRMLSCGTIEIIGTDHAPHRKGDGGEDTESNPAGVPALDTYGSLLRHLMVDRHLQPYRAVQVSSFNPSNLIGLADRGAIEPGKRADFAVLRLDGEGRPMNIYSKCRWTPYITRDFVEATMLGGKVIFRKGEPVV